MPPMRNFHYAYILESLTESGRFYVGLTDDLKARLRKHNAGRLPTQPSFAHGD